MGLEYWVGTDRIDEVSSWGVAFIPEGFLNLLLESPIRNGGRRGEMEFFFLRE